MTLARGLFVLLGAALPLLLFFRAIEAGEVGVNYGRVADNIPDPALVAKLLRDNGVTMVRIYDAKEAVVKSLANTGIKLMVMMPNDQIAAAANDPTFAEQWVQSNVSAHLPATQINGVAVGNEVFNFNPELTSQLVPAMRNVQAALDKLGLANTVKVSTPVAFDALKTSYPVSDGSFREDLALPVMKPMLDFLQRTGSYLTMNIYPLFAYANDPDHISLDYALGNPNDGVTDKKTALKYYNLLDAQIDAAHHAMEALGFAGVSLYATETGWPSKGKIKPGKKPLALRRLLDTGTGTDPASVTNARAYNNNLVNRILFGQKGTPYHPNTDLNVYIFALFNENGKSQDPDDIENSFGLFDPKTMQKVYDFSFQGNGTPPALPPPAPESWCVGNAAVGDARLQQALDYACGHGADCSALQPGGSCFDPNTTLAHASYAFNSYYQANNRAAAACNFNGAASICDGQPHGS